MIAAQHKVIHTERWEVESVVLCEWLVVLVQCDPYTLELIVHQGKVCVASGKQICSLILLFFRSRRLHRRLHTKD